jgi:hypothetical protein
MQRMTVWAWMLTAGCPWVSAEELEALGDQDGDGEPSAAFGGADCDDADPEVRDARPLFLDGDGDGFGDGPASVRCPAPAWVAAGGDCDDEDPLRSPVDADGDEVDDCTDCDPADAAVGGPTVVFLDGDGDGDGDGPPAERCAEPGWVPTDTDCDDNDPDQNQRDRDGDTETTCDGDCDDDDPNLASILPEDCATPYDDNCDGRTDEPPLSNAPVWYADTDQDGSGDAATPLERCEQPEGYVATPGDCDDGNPLLEALDVDRDGVTTCGGDCLDDNPAVTALFVDEDGDGYGAAPSCGSEYAVPLDGDCDDGDFELTPEDRDQDGLSSCDGDVCADDPGLFVEAFWYQDRDGDGFGGQDVAIACVAPHGYIGTDGDCNDGDAALNPLTRWFTDGDDDGFADPLGTSTDHCDPAYAESRVFGDCDDTQSPIRPDADACAAGDPDCDGYTEDETAACCSWVWPDGDLDAYGDLDALPVRACSGPPPGFTLRLGDADDLGPPATTDVVHVSDADELDMALQGSVLFRIIEFDGDIDTSTTGGVSLPADSTFALRGNGYTLTLGLDPLAMNDPDESLFVQDLVLVSSGAETLDVRAGRVVLVDVVATGILTLHDSDTELYGGEYVSTDLSTTGRMDLVETSVVGSVSAGDSFSAIRSTITGPTSVEGGIDVTVQDSVLSAPGGTALYQNQAGALSITRSLVTGDVAVERRRDGPTTVTHSTLVGRVASLYGLVPMTADLDRSVVWPSAVILGTATESLYLGNEVFSFVTFDPALDPTRWDLHVRGTDAYTTVGQERGFYGDAAGCTPVPATGATCHVGYADIVVGTSIPDAWMQRYFHVVDPGLESVDHDGDSRTAVQEYGAGTSPVDVDTDGDGIRDNSDPLPSQPD